MSKTLETTICGCVVRGNRHTWEYKEFAVEVRDLRGVLIRLVELPAADDADAVRKARAQAFAAPTWTYRSLGFLVKRGKCCTVMSPCMRCSGIPFLGIFMP